MAFGAKLNHLYDRARDRSVESDRGRERGDIMVVSDNSKGLILAVASSAFIGTSFILKKKGLKRAGSNGTRAGCFDLNIRSLK